jgi:hypothetical protein
MQGGLFVKEKPIITDFAKMATPGFQEVLDILL